MGASPSSRRRKKPLVVSRTRSAVPGLRVLRWSGVRERVRGWCWSRDGTGPREIGVAKDQQTTIGEENFCSSARARG